jgi:two-component system cell cycle sensor histidine kinase/response regulator CckA
MSAHGFQADNMSEELASFFEFSQEMLAILTTDGKFSRVNLAWERNLGYSVCDLTGVSLFDLVHPDDAQLTVHKFDSVFARGEPIAFSNKCWAKNGGKRWIQWNLSRSPQHPHVYASARDITQHVAADEELTRVNEILSAVLLSTPLAIWASDLEGRVEFWNEAAEETLGWTAEEVLQGTPPQALPGCQMAESPCERLAGAEMLWHRRDGSARNLRLWTAPLHDRTRQPCGTLGMVIDVTEQKRRDEQKLEENLRQIHKMEALGRLAGGVAHDFNNLLTVILWYATVLNHRLDGEHPLRESLERILQAGQQAASLTGQLLAFSRKQVTQPRILDLNGLIEDSKDMLQRLIGEDIHLAVTLDPALAPVKADASQLTQILMNLAVNARDAMPIGGELKIETRMAQQPSVDVGQTGLGRYAVLAVTDDGSGMDAQTQAHIFEPFFTTKDSGKGTGLGLATVYGIVKQHGGSIEVFSEPDHGTAFTIYLPTADRLALKPVADIVESLPRRSGTILLVEDQAAIRQAVREVLSEAGHRVLAADNGRAALQLVENNDHGIDLLITDVVMPEMSGPELAAQLSRSRPGLTTLYFSGYTDHVLLHWAIEQGTAFLQKPFLPESLLRKVDELLCHLDQLASTEKSLIPTVKTG